MERQRLLSAEENPSTNPIDDLGSSSRQRASGAAYDASSSYSPPLAQTTAAMGRMNNADPAYNPNNNPMKQKTVEATLSEYTAYAVKDNWLDEELANAMMESDAFFSVNDRVKPLEEQLDEWVAEEDEGDNAWMQSDEPWDNWGEQEKESDEEGNQVKVDPKNMAVEFLFNADDDNEDTAQRDQEEEAAYLHRLSKLQISSHRLERARDSPKAAVFFGRGPDELEGFDRLWVSAIDNVCFKNLVGSCRNYGIEFADNFGDFTDGCIEDGLHTIEDVASFKARKVYEVTGLPCIASRTSFEIEPVADFKTSPQGRPSAGSTNTVMSGYRFNDIGMHVDYICDALRLVSEPSRVTRFKTCLCYYDGEMEVFDYGVCDVDLIFCDSMKTFIPVSVAITEMVKTLQLTFGLEYQRMLKSSVEDAERGFGGGGASVKLRDRVLKEGRVLPNNIVDVSAFMDSMVDVNLMDECARELSQRFVRQKPNKILTVATTGLVIALPMAKYLQVPVVYARKERSVVMADTYKAGYSSKTVGLNRELLVSKSHLDPEDRVLIIDDFLSSGASQEALLRIVSDAGAESVGVGVLLEKVYGSGRQSLSGFDVPIHSLCRIASVKDGVIQLVEEEGFDKM
jgi:xanthine phosphoribosyltransferase